MLIFYRVGRFIELYGPQREVAMRVLKLVRIKAGRQGYAFAAGVPVAFRIRYVGRALRAGYAVCDARERESGDPLVDRRRVAAVWLPQAGGPTLVE